MEVDRLNEETNVNELIVINNKEVTSNAIDDVRKPNINLDKKCKTLWKDLSNLNQK